jgi:hypothetical protein
MRVLFAKSVIIWQFSYLIWWTKLKDSVSKYLVKMSISTKITIKIRLWGKKQGGVEKNM